MTWLKDSLDLIVFGVVVVGAFAVLLTGDAIGRHHRDEAIARATQTLELVDDALAEDRFEQMDEARVLAILAEIPSVVERQWSPAPIDKVLDSNLFYDAATLEDLRGGRELELRFPPPKDLSAQAEVGVIRLQWRRDDTGTVRVTGWAVYRQAPGEKEKRVASLPFERTQYDDRSVEAGVLYTYRVAALTDESILLKRNRNESRKSRSISVRGKRDFEILPIGWDDRTKTFRVRVKKYHGGTWYEKDFDAVKGAMIGLLDPGTGVDYRTGCLVVGVDVRTEEVEETRDEIQFDEMAKVLLKDGKPLTRRVTYRRPVRRILLHYKDPEGRLADLELRRPVED